MSFANFFNNIKTKSTVVDRVVGIDVGSSSIKVVELQSRKDVITLMTYGELQLGPYQPDKTVGQATTLEASVERQAMVDILRESAVKAHDAIFAMPLSSSFVTIMTLQATPEEDISSRVRVEARKYIPVPIAEVTLDWAEVETHDVVNETSRDVLLAAIQNEALGRFNTLMQTLEFSNPPTEIECFSTLRSLYHSVEEDVAIIDIGASSTKLYLARRGLLQRMYRVRAGGVPVTEQIAKELSLSFEEAELLKRSGQRSEKDFPLLQKIQHNVLDRVLREFKQVIDEYEARVGTEITTVYITGGGALFSGLHIFIGQQLKRPVILAEPFAKVAYPAFMEDTIRDIGPSFTVALGAALRLFE